MNESFYYYHIQEKFIRFLEYRRMYISVTIAGRKYTNHVLIGKLKDAAVIMKLPAPVVLLFISFN